MITWSSVLPSSVVFHGLKLFLVGFPTKNDEETKKLKKKKKTREND